MIPPWFLFFALLMDVFKILLSGKLEELIVFGLLFLMKFRQHPVDNTTASLPQMLLFSTLQLGGVNRFTEPDGYIGGAYKGKVILEEIVSAQDGYGDHRAAGFLGDFHATLLEGKHFFSLAAGAFGEDEDGYPLFYLLNSFQDGIQTGADIAAVQEEAVQFAHPQIEDGHAVDLFFGDKAAQAYHVGVAHQDIEVAAVVGYIQNRLVGRDVFLTDNGGTGPGNFQDQTKHELNDTQGATAH